MLMVHVSPAPSEGPIAQGLRCAFRPAADPGCVEKAPFLMGTVSLGISCFVGRGRVLRSRAKGTGFGASGLSTILYK